MAMSVIGRLLGHHPEQRDSLKNLTADEQAVERYRYLLRTAPPEAIEQVHAEAFAQLTPEQRRLVLEGLNNDLPAQERADRDDPRSLARLATRAELRRPGTLERTFGGIDPRGFRAGAGGLLGGSFLNTVAAVVVGTAIADAIFADGGDAEGYQDGAEAASADQGAGAADAGYDSGEAGYDTSGDLSVGDIGGDFGGGEF
jgi:hypothetical protein